MARKTDHLGHDSGGAKSDRWLSPSKPYTGDGRTTRQPHDPVKVTVRSTPKPKS